MSQNVLIACQNQLQRHFLSVQSVRRHPNLFTVLYGLKVIYSRMPQFHLWFDFCSSPGSQLFGEDEDDQGELDEAEKQGENG